MKAHSIATVFVFIGLFGLGLSCSKDDLGVVNNAFTQCPTNDSCEAKCYPGYIFPNGNTTTLYRCQDGDWTPAASACKRIPIKHITYSATWTFSIIPSECDNISIWLNSSKAMLEEDILKACSGLVINMTVHFTFQTLALQVTTTFLAEYTNVTGKKSVETCSSVIVITFKNKNFLLLNKLFHNITCDNQAVNYTVYKNLSISDQNEHCPIGMDVRNVTATTPKTQTEQQYCESAVTDSSPTLGTNVREQTTAPLTNIQDATTLSKDQTDLKDEETAVTTFPKDDEPTVGFPVVNNSAELVNNRFTINVIYIGASAGGATVLIVIVFVVVLVCRNRGSDISEENLKTLEMKEYASDDSFKGELTENVFYQSADDVVNDGETVHPRTSTDSNGVIYSTAKSTNKTETGLKSGVEILNQGTSLKPVDETSNGGREAEMVDNLKCDAPIVKDYKDSSHILFNAEEYAMINKSDKPL